MNVNRYYDFSGQLTLDIEGNLVQLCREHAKIARIEEYDIAWASEGDEESICEWPDCETNNNPAFHKEMSKF